MLLGKNLLNLSNRLTLQPCSTLAKPASSEALLLLKTRAHKNKGKRKSV